VGEWDIDGYEEIVFEAINFNPRSVQFASEEIRNNPEIMEAAIEQCGDAIECAGESLLNDPKSYYLKLMAFNFHLLLIPLDPLEFIKFGT